MNIAQKISQWYEATPWAIKSNPCDFETHPKLKPLGSAFATMAVDCRCCSGARVLAAALLTAFWPPAALFMTGFVLAMWGWHAMNPAPALGDNPTPTTESKE